ncbi:TonB-dependent receptor, partial [Patescibacteria group bacterium]|nr:TonB-dependent receptor [Patescibacteria group bacterium]
RRKTAFVGSGEIESRITLDVYRYDISDLIVKVNDAYINRNSALHYGAEGRVQTNTWPEHHLALSYRYAHTGDSVGDRIELIPLHRFRTEETYDINSKWHTTLAYEHVGARYSSYLNREYRLDPYHTLDLYLNYLQKSGISYRLGVKNLIDEHYEWRYGYPAQGISAFAALQWDL